MHIDEKEFFKEFTLRICSSLEIERALWHCFLYVREIMPADEMSLIVFDADTGTVENVARADAQGGRTRTAITAVPMDISRRLADLSSHEKVKILTDNPQDSFVWRIARDLGDVMASIMVSRLLIEDNLIGSLAVCTRAKGSYRPQHAHLWKLINEPTAIALVNSQRYRELLTLKERLVDEKRYLQDQLQHFTECRIVGADGGLKAVMGKIRQVAPLDSPVLLLGETGVGKEVIANEIHNRSGRHDRPFVKVNCGAIPETLIDSELFGHEKGAFTAPWPASAAASSGRIPAPFF